MPSAKLSGLHEARCRRYEPERTSSSSHIAPTASMLVWQRLQAAVRQGDISPDAIRAATGRVLRLKQRLPSWDELPSAAAELKYLTLQRISNWRIRPMLIV